MKSWDEILPFRHGDIFAKPGDEVDWKEGRSIRGVVAYDGDLGLVCNWWTIYGLGFPFGMAISEALVMRTAAYFVDGSLPSDYISEGWEIIGNIEDDPQMGEGRKWKDYDDCLIGICNSCHRDYFVPCNGFDSELVCSNCGESLKTEGVAI